MQRFFWILCLLALLLAFGSAGGAEARTSHRSSRPEALTLPRLVIFEAFFRST